MSSSELREQADVSHCQAKLASTAACSPREVATMAYETFLAADRAAKQAQVDANWAWVIADEAIKAADAADAATANMWKRLAEHAADEK